MKFQVPQFIEMEDKIFGPLSFKEFSYVAGACGLSYILYRYIPSFLLALLFIIPVLGFGAALAFYRPNNKPFIEMVQAAMMYGMGKKLYIWKKENRQIATREVNMDPKPTRPLDLSALAQNKLANISWNLDTQEKKEETNSI